MTSLDAVVVAAPLLEKIRSILRKFPAALVDSCTKGSPSISPSIRDPESIGLAQGEVMTLIFFMV